MATAVVVLVSAAPLLACNGAADCAGGEICVRPSGQCAAPGTCRSPNFDCPALWDPACGCDGRSYISPCDAERSGASIAHRGSCCVGACNALDRVTVSDLAYGVAVGLGTLRGVCQSFDRDQNQRVTIDELTAAVRNAMRGCGAP
ncbi:MAG: Kazal-type serine protease inhibitor domain-containing protein [Deltaproteobacteria bacterium]|nr:Kazal-type serine protease inhibitor domain-containing protein [Deltaproteobacteria bacterium]